MFYIFYSTEELIMNVRLHVIKAMVSSKEVVVAWNEPGTDSSTYSS